MNQLLSCSATHCVRVCDAAAYTWAKGGSGRRRRGNRFGQLGRAGDERGPGGEEGPDAAEEGKVEVGAEVGHVVAASAGGTKDSGHTLLVGADGAVWAFGCDRWQQLGLGSTAAGAVGYTWENGRLWQNRPKRVAALGGERIIAVAAGGDHSVALTADGAVFTWGRGEHGQLGHLGKKPFVMPPTKSEYLSGDSAATILAEKNCTAVIGRDRQSILRHAGRCPGPLLERMMSRAES